MIGPPVVSGHAQGGRQLSAMRFDDDLDVLAERDEETKQALDRKLPELAMPQF